MVAINKCFIAGNLSSDPDLRYISTGSAVCSFGLAINEKYKKDEEWKTKVCFVNITVWGKPGEACAQYLTKGSSVLIEGKLDYQTWEKDGQKRSKLEVTANSVNFLDQKKTDKPHSGTNPYKDGEIPF